jgi:heat shock protein HslJ
MAFASQTAATPTEPTGTEEPPSTEEAPAGDGGITGGASGTTFEVVSFGPAGAEAPVIPGTEITALFSDTEISGNSGCNSYLAPLVPANDFFNVGPIASTRQFCAEPEGIMEQEVAFLAALAATNGYEWQQTVVDDVNVITAGRLLYTLADGTNGVMNLIAP